MDKIIVLHNVDGVGEIHPVNPEGKAIARVCGRFSEFCSEHSALRVVYGYYSDRSTLDEIFRDNNRVDGSEIERPEMDTAGVHSLSVGDVVVVMRSQDDGGFAHTAAWAVASLGWTEVELIDVLEATGRPVRERTVRN